MDKKDYLFEQWKLASELHRHEDNLAWQKFNYFIAVNGLLLSVLAVNWKDLAASSNNLRVIGIAISVFGTIISLAWFLVQWRGQLYHALRTRQAKKAEEDIEKITGERWLDLYSISLNDKQQKFVRVPLPAKIPIHWVIVGLGFLSTIFWICLIFYFA